MLIIDTEKLRYPEVSGNSHNYRRSYILIINEGKRWNVVIW